ncbi:MAG: alginate lyase family protein [Vulcanimicrobiota bacterium]
MLKKLISRYFLKFSEGKVLIEDLYKKRSSKKGIPRLSDGEFFSYLRIADNEDKAIKDAYRERDFDLAKRELIKYYKERESPVFFFHYGSGKRDIFRDQSSSCRTVLESAEKIYNHTMSTVSGESKSFGTFIDWFSDFDGKSWIYCHITDLNKKLSERHVQKLYNISNLPITMEFNKHHHLVDLGRAYFLTGDEKYAQEFVIELEDWIDKNPVNWGVNWLDPLTVAQRMLSWLLSLGFFLHSPHLTGGTFCTLMKSLFFHGAYIVEHLSDKTVRPAKLIGLASSLYLFSSLFPEFECQKRWKDKAVKTLESEAVQQFSIDGVHREQSLGLQTLLTEFLMVPLLWDRVNFRSSSPVIRNCVEKSLEFLMYTIQPNGKAQTFGEIPITRAWRLGVTSHEDFKPLLALGALLYERGDMKSIAGNSCEDILWFFHDDGTTRYERMTSHVPDTRSRAFAEGGFLFFRDGWERDSTYCNFHSGPRKRWGYIEKGMEGLAPHRDLMNFALSVRGEPFIIETGSYRGKKQFGSYFTKTGAHNVIIIDGKEQSHFKNFKGSKKFLQYLKTKWIFTDDLDYVVSGSPGFEDLKSHVIHRREILYLRSKKWFLVKDSLEGFDEFIVELNYHFAPELEIILRGDHGCFIRGRRDFFRLNPYFPCNFSCSLNRGKLEPLAGWYAKDFIRVEPCYRLEYFAKMKLPAEIYTWISWARGEFRIPAREELDALFKEAGEMRGINEPELPPELDL